MYQGRGQGVGLLKNYFAIVNFPAITQGYVINSFCFLVQAQLDFSSVHLQLLLLD